MRRFYLLSLGIACALSAPQRYYQQGYRYQQPYANRSPTQAVQNSDAENPKFLGASNQEDESRGIIKKLKWKKKLNHKLNHLQSNPCYFKQARDEGRFLWDLNVYNVYQAAPQNPCGGGFGGVGGAIAGAGAGLFSDPVYQRPQGFFSNFLNLLVPGGVLNPTGGVRPQVTNQFTNQFASTGIANDPVNFDDPGTGIVTTAGTGLVTPAGTTQINPAALTPGQLVGGVAHTVNNVIQTLSGNVRPGRYLDYFF